MSSDDFDLKKKMHGGGSVKIATWHSQAEVTSHLIEYSYIPVTVFITDYLDGSFGLEFYLEGKRMQGERTLALEQAFISDLRAGCHTFKLSAKGKTAQAVRPQ